MKEFLKKGFYLGVGVFTLTKEKIEQVVDDLVHRGEADQSDRANLIDEFMEKAQEFEKELNERVKKIVQNYGFVSKKEFETLKKKVEELEKQQAAQKTAAPKTGAKKTTAGKSGAKKSTTKKPTAKAKADKSESGK